MKQIPILSNPPAYWPAAFGRLCVETRCADGAAEQHGPAAFGRLCVETRAGILHGRQRPPAAFGRLCVETLITAARV